MGIVRDLYYARKMSAGLKLPAPTVALLIKRLRLAAAMGGGVTKTVSGSPAHITDALAKDALSVLVNITPTQDLHGYSHPWPAGGGINKLPNNATNETKSSNGVEIKAENGVYTITGTPTAGNSITFDLADSVDLSPSTNKIAFLNNVANGKISVYFCRSGTPVHYWGMNPVNRVASGWTDSGNEVVNQIEIAFNTSAGSNLNITVSPMLIATSETNPTSYSPYSNICPISGRTGLSVYVGPTQDQQDATTYAVDWTTEAGTVYGGTVDVVTGVLTVDRANIASYNGEVINEPWLSSMDAYTPGATPTTGAQVVYTLATPLTYQLTAQEVQMLLGENYVWSSSGDTVSVTYYAEGNANDLQSLNILLGGNYSNPKTADDVSDKEALEIILGGNK